MHHYLPAILLASLPFAATLQRRRQDPDPIPSQAQACASQSNCLLATSRFQQCLSPAPTGPKPSQTALNSQLQKCLCDDGGIQSYTPWKFTVSSCLSCLNSGGIQDSVINTVALAVDSFCNSNPPDTAAYAILSSFLKDGLQSFSAPPSISGSGSTNAASFTILTGTVTSPTSAQSATISTRPTSTVSPSPGQSQPATSTSTSSSSSLNETSRSPSVSATAASPAAATATNLGSGPQATSLKLVSAFVAVFMTLLAWLMA